MRRSALLPVVVTGVLLLSACGKNSNDGTLPVPAGGSDATTSSDTPSAEPTEPSSAPTQPAATTKPTTAAKAQIIIKAGNFASNPAVQGLVTSYPLYFQALVSKDDTVLKKKFPSFFYSDVSEGIFDAQRNGWIMKPPGSVVIVGAKSTPDGTVAVQTCRSQTTQYWDPKAKKWTVVTPNGSPEVIEMIKTGIGWLPYRLATSTGVKCSGVHYPA
ncbi:hypothetical protein ACFWUU_16515 [Kribbella sp. NPDC058693]|uniref:hypothetical protein n=1 Tax=Kribbella sp. NPDC058693 TaxID=3346602 RepID=UPI00365FCF06